MTSVAICWWNGVALLFWPLSPGYGWLQCWSFIFVFSSFPSIVAHSTAPSFVPLSQSCLISRCTFLTSLLWSFPIHSEGICCLHKLVPFHLFHVFFLSSSCSTYYKSPAPSLILSSSQLNITMWLLQTPQRRGWCRAEWQRNDRHGSRGNDDVARQWQLGQPTQQMFRWTGLFCHSVVVFEYVFYNSTDSRDVSVVQTTVDFIVQPTTLCRLYKVLKCYRKQQNLSLFDAPSVWAHVWYALYWWNVFDCSFMKLVHLFAVKHGVIINKHGKY